MAQISALYEDPDLDIGYVHDMDEYPHNNNKINEVKAVQRKLSLWDELAEIEPIQNENDYYFETETNDYFYYDEEEEEEEEEKELATRKAWKAGDLCLIYSRSKDKWFDGKISVIRITQNIEWLVVKFGEFGKKKKTKKIQRFCKDIKPIPIDHASYIVVGSHVQIFSYISTKWCEGEVIGIIYDEQGEWLKVKYSERKIVKICDIQRYSQEIRLVFEDVNDLESNKDTVISSDSF